MKRYEILNKLIDKNNYKHYLEIGVQHGECLRNVNIEHKTGVDPDHKSPATIHMTSDDFFAMNRDSYDLIFIDGLHHADQVYRDVTNAMKILNGGGTIMCHDMLPTSEEAQKIPLTTQSTWMGDCWKAWVKLRQKNTNYKMVVVNADCGCGIIKSGINDILEIDGDINYKSFVDNKHEWMNIIEPGEINNAL